MRSVLLLVLLPLQVAPSAPAQGFYTGRQTFALGGGAYSPTLSGNELYMIFASRRSPGAGGWDLWETRRSGIDAPWGAPTNLAALNTANDEYEPTLLSNESELHFVRRATGVPASTILRSTRTMTGWSAPTPAPGLPAPNTVALDDPYLTMDGLTMYYTETAVNNGDIFIVNRTSLTSPWMNRRPFTVANGTGVDRSPMPDGDGGVVFFSRAVGTGPSDLFVTWTNRIGPYATPVPVADVNSPLSERNGHLGTTTGRLYLSVDPLGAALLDGYCPVPVSCAIAGRAHGTLGRTFPGTSPPPPHFAKSFVWSVAIGSAVAVGWRDWRTPPPPPEVGVLIVSAIANPPNIQIPGFRGSFNLDATTLVILGTFPVSMDGTVVTPISVPNDPSLRGASVEFQLARVVLSNRTGAFSHLAQFDLR